MDGSVEYTFDGNNNYQLRTYDALSGESHDYSGRYAIDLINKGTITINPQMSDYSNVTYTLVKLTSKEMVWQKEGTTYSVGTWGGGLSAFYKISPLNLFRDQEVAGSSPVIQTKAPGDKAWRFLYL